MSDHLVMTHEPQYPVQPFVFEFAKEASKSINFRDLHISPSPRIDMTPVDAYLEANGSFLDEFGGLERDQSQTYDEINNCKVDAVFFRRDFDLRRDKIFEEVFPSNCLKSRLFAEKLVVQLETVQELLFHASDQHALEFFKSFSMIHDMNHELSVLLPEVKKMRQELGELKHIANSSITISKLKQKKERWDVLRGYVDSMKEITDAKPKAIALAQSGSYKDAFDVIENASKLMTGKLLSVKSLQSYVASLRDTYKTIEQQAKNCFFELFKGDNIANSDYGIIEVLAKKDILLKTTDEAVDFIGEFAVDSVRKILSDACDSRQYKTGNLSTLSVKEFTDVLSTAFPNIRSKMLNRSADAVSRISSEFNRLGIETTSLKAVSRALADRIFKEVTTVVSAHPLKGASLDDFSNMFESMISFGRSFESFMSDQALIQASLMALSRAFVESLHSEQISRLRASLAAEKWVKREPEKEHIEIIKKLTTDVSGLVIKDDHYGATTSLLVLLEITWNYLQTARKIPRTGDDITSKLIDAVRMFNTQSYDLLIKGGSLQTAKMKTISTKNLALSAAGVDFYRRLIPYMKPRLTVVGANPETLEKQFSDLVSQLTIHYQTLIEKIIDVLNRIITKACDAAEIDIYKPSQYAQYICNEVLTLNKGIVECLPTSTLSQMFVKIGAVISAAVSKLQKSHRGMERHISRDVEYINDQLKVCPCTVSLQ